MNKLFLILPLVILLSSITFGQHQNYPEGVYLSLDEIKQKSPSIVTKLNIHRRSKGDIKMNGGNDYKILSPDKSIRKKTIKKEYLAYSNGDSLFINCRKYKIQAWYAKVISDGKYLVFSAGLSMIPEMQKEQLHNQVQMGYMLGAIGGALEGAHLAMLRFIYIINKESNEINTISIKYLKEILAEYPELLKQYNSEEQQAGQDVFLKYLQLLNEVHLASLQ